MQTLRVGELKRIAVVGVSGAGKSTFSRALSQKLGLPVYHCDPLEFLPGWRDRPLDAVLQDISSVTRLSHWIIEGRMDHHRTERLKAADLVIDLNCSRWRCLVRLSVRMLLHRPRPDLPAGCIERLNWRNLTIALLKRERPVVDRALEAAAPKAYLRFDTPKAARDWLNSVEEVGLE